ncbi:MAG: hypothetical protein CMJ65_16580 [Planctomycetaceae bacterium]|nr:hypothetical protein [Planctomycetaceae bacterium]
MSALAEDILNRIEALLVDAERTTRPLEVDPYRGQLFELFVTVNAAGFLVEGAPVDLRADAISSLLAQRWKLADAAQDSAVRQEKLSNESLGRMRMLWSFLRMWMEWSYAWERWPEFHDEA